MSDVVIRIASILMLVLICLTAWSADITETDVVELPEAPLEDVWPALSEEKFGDLDAMIERGEIRVLDDLYARLLFH